MPTGSGYLAGPLRVGLTDHIRQVKTTVRMPAGSLHDLDGVNRWYRGATQTNWVIEAIPRPQAFNEFRLSGLAQWDDYPGEPGLLRPP
jgi:hypothetical protein